MASFSYRPLLRILFERKMSKTQFREALNISTRTLAKISKDENVSMELLARICDYFNCRIEDIIEFIPSEKEKEID